MFHFKNNLNFVGELRHKLSSLVYTSSKIWSILLIKFSILLLLIVGFSSYVFYQINKGEFFKVDSDNSIKVDSFDRELLTETVGFYKNREQIFEELKRRGATSIDPSL